MQGQDKVEFLKSQGADIVLDLANTSKETPLNALIKQHAPRGELKPRCSAESCFCFCFCKQRQHPKPPKPPKKRLAGRPEQGRTGLMLPVCLGHPAQQWTAVIAPCSICRHYLSWASLCDCLEYLFLQVCM
jgi:hypothetical protein